MYWCWRVFFKAPPHSLDAQGTRLSPQVYASVQWNWNGSCPHRMGWKRSVIGHRWLWLLLACQSAYADCVKGVHPLRRQPLLISGKTMSYAQLSRDWALCRYEDVPPIWPPRVNHRQGLLEEMQWLGSLQMALCFVPHAHQLTNLSPSLLPCCISPFSLR